MNELLLPLILCFLRVSGFVAFLPPLGGQHLPNLVKIGVVLVLTMFWLPGSGSPVMPALETGAVESSVASTDGATMQTPAKANVNSSSSRGWLLWTWLGVREVTLGAVIGWVLGQILVPMRIAGAWLGEQLGLEMASVTTGMDSGSMNVLAALIETLGLLLLYSSGIHRDFLRIFDQLFSICRIGTFQNGPEAIWIIRMLNHLPEQGLMIAAPVGVLFVLILITLLIAMKQAPQFNLFTVGMPLRLAAGVIAMAVMFPDVLGHVTRHLQSFLLNPS